MKNKGMTMLEIIIVLALVAIVSAVVIPNFINSTAKAKLTSDIYSARVIQSAMDIYNVEQSSPLTTNNMDTVITELNTKGYLKQKSYSTQTANSSFVYSDSLVKLNVTAVDDKFKAAYDNLSDNDKLHVIIPTS